jgi:hypothetical protein
MVNAAYSTLREKFNKFQITKKTVKDSRDNAFGDGWGIFVCLSLVLLNSFNSVLKFRLQRQQQPDVFYRVHALVKPVCFPLIPFIRSLLT